MQTLETIRTFRTKNFTVEITAESEPYLDLSFDETGEIENNLDTGKLVSFCAAWNLKILTGIKMEYMQ